MQVSSVLRRVGHAATVPLHLLAGAGPAVAIRLALTNLAAQAAIVATGGAVRLTGSGLGCPTWPRCVDDSYTPTPAMGINGVIEFGNRTLTGVLGVIAAALLVAVWRHRPTRRLAIGVLGGIALQGAIGGITVRTGLNPWVVGLHFLISAGLIAVSYALWRRTREAVPPTPEAAAAQSGPANAPRVLGPLGWATTAAAALVLVAGVLVTGSGPHSGDETAGRTGFDPEMISQLHVDAVMLLLGLSLASWLTARALGARGASRAAAVLLAVLLGQGAIGFVQYFTHLPIVLVGAHMLGACLVWTATLSLLWATLAPRPHPRGTAPAGGSAPNRAAGTGRPELVTAR